jgi:hypothetical protein
MRGITRQLNNETGMTARRGTHCKAAVSDQAIDSAENYLGQEMLDVPNAVKCASGNGVIGGNQKCTTVCLDKLAQPSGFS